MERPRLTLISLIYVLLCSQRRISGTEVEMKVRPGENITLYCDLSLTTGSMTVWIRNCSHENQPSLVIEVVTMEGNYDLIYPFSFIYNPVNNSYDLHITDISVSHLGLYYCAKTENKLNKDEKGILSRSKVYYYGNRTTHLSFVEPSCSGLSNITSAPPHVSECVFCWNLLFSVCSVCVLLFSICVLCLCQKKTTDVVTDQNNKQQQINTFKGEDEEVCIYTSVDLITRQNQRKSKRLQCSDFSTYAQVRTETE